MTNTIHAITFAALFFFMLLAGGKAQAADIEITAQLSNNRFSVEEAAQLTVTVTGTRKATIDIPEVEGLIIHSRGSQRSMQSVNGKTSFSFSSIYMIQSLSAGKYTIPPITASVKAETYTTEPISLEVSQSSAQQSQSSNQRTLTSQQVESEKNELAFVRFIPKKTEGYVGEVIPIQIKTYFQIQARDITLPVLKGEGFILPPLSQNPLQTQESVNGTPYMVYTWDSTLSGVKEGSFPSSVSLNATLLLRRARSNDPFSNLDPFGRSLFDDFFSNNIQGRPVTLQSDTVTFNIKPLPTAQQPESFSGAIGQFSIQAKATPQSVEPGEPVTLQLEITGQGNFDRVQCPTFPDQQNFKIYQPTSEQGKNSLSKTFERAIVVKNPDITEIPAHNFTYFDPEREQYVTIKSNPLPLNVKASYQPVQLSSAIPRQPAAAPQQLVQQSPPMGNLAPQKLEVGNLHNTIQPLIKTTWFIVLCLICLMTLISLAWLRYTRQARLKNPSLTRNKESAALLHSNLQKIRSAQETGNRLLVLSNSRNAIQQQAGLLFQMEPSAITVASLRQHAPGSEELIALLELAEQGAYGGSSMDKDELEEFVDRVAQELEKLQ